MQIVNKKNSENYRWGNNCDGWRLVNLPETSIIQEKMPAGTSEKEHYHKIARQFFFVLEGEASIDIGGRVFKLQKHEGIEIEPGIIHRIFNSSDEPAEFIVTSVPSILNDRHDIT